MAPSTISPRPHSPSNRLVVVSGRDGDAYPPAPPARKIGVLLAHAEPLKRASRRRPDVVVIDLRLPGLGGMEAMRRLLADPEAVRPAVLVLSCSERDEELFAALRAGASGVLVGDTVGNDLVRAIRVVAGGGALLSPRLTRRLIDEVAAQPEPPMVGQLDDLTAREREVVRLVAMGLTNDEIAERLVVSPAT